MASVGCQGVTVRTDTAERAWCVVATEGALVAQFQALVHVFADLIGTRRESVIAGALETAFDVAARAVAADVLDT